MEEMLFYHCKKCENAVMSLKNFGSDLTCCGEPMIKMVANSVEASNEKHIPVVKIDGNKIIVTVGSDLHPMNPDHYIEWIAISMEEKFEIVHLKPGMLPKAIFTYETGQDEGPYTEEEDEFLANCEGQPCNFVLVDDPIINVKVYAYCNIHGLWEKELEY